MGGMGVIYKVLSKKEEMIFALKTLQSSVLNEEAVSKRFKKEADIWINLERHPFVLNAYYLITIQKQLYIATDWIGGEAGPNTIEGYLKSPDLGMDQIIKWGIQICSGMEFAVSSGIRCHRDLKPANILVDEYRHIKIADFGLAGVLHEWASTKKFENSFHWKNLDKTQRGEILGSPPYMSPEHFIDASSCDARSDVYSTGMILYQLTNSGSMPFDEEAREALKFGPE